MKCVDTRVHADGFRHRRYLTPQGETRRTVEIPDWLWRRLSAGNSKIIEACKQNAKKRERLVYIGRLLAQNVKPTAIAAETGVTEQYVRQLRKRLRQKGKLP